MRRRMLRSTTDGLEILDRLYFNTPAKQRALAKAVLSAEIAQEIYALRTKRRADSGEACQARGHDGVGHLQARRRRLLGPLAVDAPPDLGGAQSEARDSIRSYPIASQTLRSPHSTELLFEEVPRRKGC